MRILLMSMLAFSALPSAFAADTAPRPFNTVVEGRIRPQLERLLRQLVKEGRVMQIDGTPVFNGSDKFLPGKIALALSDLIATLPADDPRLSQYIADFQRIAKLTVDDANDS